MRAHRGVVDWKDHTNVRKYMDWLGVKLGYTEMDDWYKIDCQTIKQNQGLSLLKAHHGSPSLILSFTFPQHKWAPYRFKSTPKWFKWETHAERREYIEWLGKQLGYSKLEDWYDIDFHSFQKHHGGTLLAKYSNSPSAVVMGVFDDHKWERFLFHTPTHFYNNPQNQRAYMEWLGERLGFKKMEDWYNIDTYTFLKNNGRNLLPIFNYFPSKIVAQIFNEHKWEMFKFTTPEGHWKDPQNQREYMEWLGRELGYTKMEDWYKISAGLIQNNKGASLLSSYQNSPSRCVMEVFREHKWYPFKFASIPNNYWKSETNRKEYVEWLGNELGYRMMEDWYNVHPSHFTSNFGNALLTSFESPMGIVMDAFKNYKWDESRFAHQTPWKSQAALVYSVSVLFSEYTLLENYRPKLLLPPDGSKPLDFDVFIPKLNLAFEYQGIQHYTKVRSLNAHRHAQTQARDQLKVEMCAKEGITLIVVPYWWDKQTSSLHATLYKNTSTQDIPPQSVLSPPFSSPSSRQDLHTIIGPPPEGAVPIPALPTKKNKVAAARWALDSYYDFGKQIVGRLMYEIYDGVQVYWDGSNLITTKGQYLHPPKIFTYKLPTDKIRLYGTLWAGYNKQKELRRAIHEVGKAKEDWANVTFFISDCSIPKPFGERLDYLNSLSLPPHAKVVQTVVCQSKEHQQKFHAEIMQKGGKGIAMKSPSTNRLYCK